MLAMLALWLLAFAAAVPAGAESLRASEFKMESEAERARISFHLDEKAEPRWFLLRAPHRIVIDLPPTKFAFDPASARPAGLVTSVRYGHFDAEHSRMILASDGPFYAERFQVRPREDGEGFDVTLELAAAPEARFEKQLAERAGLQRHEEPEPDSALPSGMAATRNGKPFTIVLDPGHGGIDGGARGVSGIEEKTITLAFAKELREKLEEAGEYQVVMTRDADRFLRLRDRVRIAREHEADLFISIHADTIRYRDVRGATVYTVSSKASDRMAAEIAEGANLADRVAGIAAEETREEVTDILLDLLKRETQTFSIAFARTLVGELSTTVEMIKNPHRSAGFQVLTAPDVPSVLVELGYLSNPQDEEAMRDPEWRSKAAQSIIAAIREFARLRANGMGG